MLDAAGSILGIASWLVAVMAAGPTAPATDSEITHTFRFGGKPSDAVALVRTPDGRVVVAGSGEAASFTGVAALGPDGRSDATAGGVAVHDVAPDSDNPHGVDAGDDGGVLVTGAMETGPDIADEESDEDAFVLRLGRDGRRVSSFGEDGIVTLAPGRGRAAFEQASSARLLADGRVLVAGSDDRGIFLARLLPDGRLDPAFGRRGVSHPFPGIRQAFGVRLADDGRGRLVVVSSAVASGTIDEESDTRDLDWMIARVGRDGRPDREFGRRGVAMIDIGREHRDDLDGVDGVRVVRGRITVTGSSGDSRLAAVRLRGDGALDRGYGAGGRAFGPRSREGYATAVDERGAAWFATSDGRRTSVSRLTPRGLPTRAQRVVVDLSRRRHEIVRGLVPPSGRSPAMLAVTVGGSGLFEGDISVVALGG